MPNPNQFLGFTWQEPSAIRPRIVMAMYYSKHSDRAIIRVQHPFWILDCSRTPCGRVRVGSPRAPWRERPSAIAHLYPPNTPFWEDTRDIVSMAGAHMIFSGGDEAGLQACIPKGQAYARISDPHGLILGHLHAAAIAGAEKGAAGFWEAQTALCALIPILRRIAPQGNGADAIIGPASTTNATPFVKEVNAFLATRMGGRVSLAEMAKAVGVSPSSLSHRYAVEAGQSPFSAFTTMRLNMARSLIVSGQKLEAVAAHTGFCDAYHLSKAFTNHFAESPATYRRRIVGPLRRG